MDTNLSNPPERLGHRLGEFGWNKGRAKFLLGIWAFLLLLSLPLSLALIGLPGLIVSSWIVYRSIQRLRETKPIIQVYQQGLIDRRQKPNSIIYYEEIKNLFLSVVVISGVLNYVVTLETQKGQKIKFDEHIGDINQLRTLIEEQFVQSRLSETIASYQQGNPIVFGNLVLTQTGLSSGQRTLPWSAFESADIQRRSNWVEFVIRQKGSKEVWFLASRDTFPNLALFFAFLNAINVLSPREDLS